MFIKKILSPLLCALFLMTCSSTEPATYTFSDFFEDDAPEAVLRTAPFSHGVNFSGWFEMGNAGEIWFSRYAEQDFADVKSLGIDVIRLPVIMHGLAPGLSDFTLDPLLLKILDFAVDLAEKYELYLIIDDHPNDPENPLSANVEGILHSVWAQIAERYKNRSGYIVYEILNEPHDIDDSAWGEIQGRVIDTIRKIDQNRLIVVSGTGYSSLGKLPALPEYDDPNLIYTFHFYDPFLFTHQGTLSLMSLMKGVPFPYDKQRMPAAPREFKGTWFEDLMRNYAKDTAPKKLFAPLDEVVAFSRERNVPVFCGEFGVHMVNSPKEDRIKWYEVITPALDRRNIPRINWEYFGGWGIFNTNGGRDFNSDLNTDIARALGFTPPPQQPAEIKTPETGFTIFNDYSPREFAGGYWGEGEFSMYDTSPYEGEYCIRWSNPARHNGFWIQFDHGRDFSFLEDAGFCLEFKARTEQAVRFDVRFLNNGDASSIPWRIRYTIDENILPPDGKWHIIRIPLKDMKEQGAWIDAKQQWFEPEGKFSWEKIDQLQFTTEEKALPGCTFWLDAIKITEP